MKDKNLKLILGIAFALPSTILGTFALAYALVKNQTISEGWALVLVVLVSFNSIYLMIKYVLAKK